MKSTYLFKIALFFFISTQTMADSPVTLSNGGNVAAQTSLNIALTPLQPSVTYDVVCYIDTIYPFHYLLLGSSFSENISVINSYSLNGSIDAQGQLAIGHNIVVVQGVFASPSTGSIVITNLDQTNPFSVSNCFAIPV